MRRRNAARGPAKRRRRTATHGARKPTVVRKSAASMRAQLDLRTRERDEAIEQQSATSEILRVIASSPTEIQSVLDAIATTAARLLDVARRLHYARRGSTTESRGKAWDLTAMGDRNDAGDKPRLGHGKSGG